VLFQFTQREIIMRNPVYPHMLPDILRGLSSGPAVESDCRDTLGFTGLEAVSVLRSLMPRLPATTCSRLPESSRETAPGRGCSGSSSRSYPLAHLF
jgi:hypothetical protein